MVKNQQKTVVVGMSGGVDSSLSAALLKEQGYAVIGMYMKNWSEPIKGVEHCPWVQDQLDARRVANQLDIPFYTINFEQQYKQAVVNSFFADYAAGRTPNPDILCNQFIKFDAFFHYARSLGADYIATGHYAQIKDGTLLKGADPKKDQTYFLWAIEPSVLPNVLFPIGHMTKDEVRAEAAKRNLVTAAKKDSQGICFIGTADVRDFLASKLHPQEGVVLNEEGEEIGTHHGAWFYTIGQRSGVSDLKWQDDTKRPTLYVLTTDTKNNTITIGEESKLYKPKLSAEQASWFNRPQDSQKVTAKIRYGHSAVPCVIVGTRDKKFDLEFDEPQRAITPGQSVVVYDGEQVLGGGIIS